MFNSSSSGSRATKYATYDADVTLWPARRISLGRRAASKCAECTGRTFSLAPAPDYCGICHVGTWHTHTHTHTHMVRRCSDQRPRLPNQIRSLSSVSAINSTLTSMHLYCFTNRQQISTFSHILPSKILECSRTEPGDCNWTVTACREGL